MIRFENGVLGIVGNYFGSLFSALSFDFPSHMRSPLLRLRYVCLLRCLSRVPAEPAHKTSPAWKHMPSSAAYSFDHACRRSAASADSAPRIHSRLTATSSHVNNVLHAHHGLAIETPVMIERAS
jgi:hypothetical protein